MGRLNSGKPAWMMLVWSSTLATVALWLMICPRSVHSADAPPKTLSASPAKASHPAPNPAAAKNRLTIRAVADRSGQPLVDAPIEFHEATRAGWSDTTLHTNHDGVVEFEWRDKPAVEILFVTAKPARHVPQHYQLRNTNSNLPIPTRLELRFEAGTAIGGIVRDESGRPIANATVQIDIPITWPRLPNSSFQAADCKTDANGRWTWSEAPADIAGTRVEVRHPDFRPEGSQLAKSLTNMIVLKQGLKIAGRVFDPHKRPVAGATAAVGYELFSVDDPEGKTDGQGRFVVKNCEAGRTLVTVQAEGFAPSFQEITIAEKTPDLQFELEPGRVLHIRIVDMQGKPVRGAQLVTDTWRGHRSIRSRLESDAAGRITWRSAPADAVLCDFLKQGFLPVRQRTLTASAEEQVITLPPELVISGHVIDGNTGKPIKNVEVRQGQIFNDMSSWSGRTAVSLDDGSYRMRFDEPVDDGQFLQAAAPGYRPATCRVVEGTEGKLTLDFALRRGRDLIGTVLFPTGKPVSGAEVFLATPQRSVRLRQGRINRMQTQADVVKTDAHGRFAFPPPPEGGFVLVVVDKAGFAEVRNSELDLSTRHVDRITLRPWGRLKGRSLNGKRTDPRRQITFSRVIAPSHQPFLPEWFSEYTTETDADGRFEFDRIIPGKGVVARVTAIDLPGWHEDYPGWQAPVDVGDGQTLELTLGGTGRPVIGRVRFEGRKSDSIDWSANAPATVKQHSADDADEKQIAYYGKIDRTGSFRIPDIPAGDYNLTIEVRGPLGPNGSVNPIGVARRHFTVPLVPNGRSDESLDLGEIRAKDTR